MKTNLTAIETKTATAAVLGTMAFNAGIKRIPAMDKNLEPLLNGQIGEGVPVLKAWLASWDAANLTSK